MIREFRNALAMFFVLLFAFLLDGSLPLLFIHWTGTLAFKMLPAVLFLSLVLLALVMREGKTLIFLAAIFGFLYDLYYTKILGVNFLLFPLFVYLARYIKEKFELHLYTLWLGALFLYALREQLIYWLYGCISLQSETYFSFLINNLLPSLLINGIICAVLVLVINFFTDLIEENNNEDWKEIE